MFAGLDLTAKCLLGEGAGTDKINLDNFDLWAFFNFKGDGGAAGGLFDGRRIRHLGARVARFLVFFLDLLSVGENFAFVEGLADLGSDELPQFGIAEFLVPVKEDFRQARIALDDVGQDEPAGSSVTRTL